MLIDMDVTIAYKCSSCGTFDFTNINLFKLFLQNGIVSKCRCKSSELQISASAKKEYIISVPCIACGLEHKYTVSREELINSEIKICTCPITGIKQCFIGKDDIVRGCIDRFEQEMDNIIDDLGYESYFFNTQVMIDTLNKIHDIAEQGRLYCTCGCDDIIVSLLKKGIGLKCSRCSGSKLIPAATNNDLRKTLRKGTIIVSGKKSQSILSDI